MSINQVNLAYIPAEDRLLLRFNTQDQAEFKLWVTRAVTRLWLRQLEKSEEALLGRPSPNHIGLDPTESRRLSLASQTQNADFSTPYNEQASHYPLGELPSLVIGLGIQASESHVAIQWNLSSRQGLNMKLEKSVYLALVRLLLSALPTANWGLTGQGAGPGSPREAGEPTPTVLH